MHKYTRISQTSRKAKKQSTDKQLLDDLNSLSKQSFFLESKKSQYIKLASEVEKIWILYDIDQNGNLDYEELIQYFNDVAVPCLSFSPAQMYDIFKDLDQDEDQSISKDEMVLFLAKIIHLDEYDVNIKTVSKSNRAQEEEMSILTQAGNFSTENQNLPHLLKILE